jgi:hypothetical protein
VLRSADNPCAALVAEDVPERGSDIAPGERFAEPLLGKPGAVEGCRVEETGSQIPAAATVARATSGATSLSNALVPSPIVAGVRRERVWSYKSYDRNMSSVTVVAHLRPDRGRHRSEPRNREGRSRRARAAGAEVVGVSASIEPERGRAYRCDFADRPAVHALAAALRRDLERVDILVKINVPGYTAAKSGIAGLTKAFANEWAAQG